MLPKNAAFGNLWRESGISPESELLARLTAARWGKVESDGGMWPENRLLERSRTERFVQGEKSGKGPVRLLKWR